MQHKIIQSTEAKKVITKARERHWRFKHIGNDGMIDNPTLDDEWLKVPIEQDTSIIPKRAINRVRYIQESGFKIQGVIVAHEAPKLLTAPVMESKPVETPSKESISAAESLVEIFSTVLTGFGYVLLFMPLVLLDPVLIVVLESGEEIEVMRWYE